MNLENIHLKKFEESDWLTLKNIRLKALKNDPGVFGSNYKKESAHTKQDWLVWLQNKNSCIFGVYDGASIIGMTGIAIDREDPEQKSAVLWGSWLEPAYRGKGLSKRMYEQRIGWAKQHPTCALIKVSHRKSNTASKGANQKHGFAYSHTITKEWPDGGTDDDLFYTLRIK